MRKLDPRYARLRAGLSQLPDGELRRILSHEEPMCCNDYYYDEKNKFY